MIRFPSFATFRRTLGRARLCPGHALKRTKCTQTSLIDGRDEARPSQNRPLFSLFTFHFSLLSLALSLSLAPTPASAQLGPFEVKMKGGTVSAQLYKREKNTVWLRRMSADGTPGPQVGYDASDILAVAMPRPPFFTNVDAIITATNRVPAPAFARAHAALDKFILQSRPFRDLPGVQSDEAIYLKARLYDLQNLPSDALTLYDSLRSKDPPSLFATNAMIRAGIVHARLTNSLEAVECLSGVLLPEDDEPLLSDLLFALGDAYVQLGNWDHALLSYLPLVVCYPYYGQNEVRALAKTLPCYAALKEWEPLYRTIQDIRRLYPDSPAAAYAAQFVKKYKNDLGAAGGFVESGERLTDDIVPDAVAGTTAAKDAPDYTQIPTAPAAAPAEDDEIEYPPDL